MAITYIGRIKNALLAGLCVAMAVCLISGGAWFLPVWAWFKTYWLAVVATNLALDIGLCAASVRVTLDAHELDERAAIPWNADFIPRQALWADNPQHAHSSTETRT